jgi:hypothetical protein
MILAMIWSLSEGDVLGQNPEGIQARSHVMQRLCVRQRVYRQAPLGLQAIGQIEIFAKATKSIEMAEFQRFCINAWRSNWLKHDGL